VTAAVDAGHAAAEAEVIGVADACAYSPAFVDDATVVYDVTRGETMDIYAVAASGGASRQLTNTPEREFRAWPGRAPGEIVFIVSDPSKNNTEDATRIGVLDLASGARHDVARPTTAPVGAGGALYYTALEGHDIRRIVGDRDELAFHAPGGTYAMTLTPSPDGRRMAILSRTPTGSAMMCVATLDAASASAEPSCPKALPMVGGRPAWSADGEALYYAGATGVRRLELATGRDDELLPGVVASGGIAVSPDGTRLVWSDCAPRGPIRDLAHPEQIVVDDPFAQVPVAGPNGTLAYVRRTAGRRTLVIRDADGTLRDLTDQSLGDVNEASFRPDGAEVAMIVEGPNPGIYSVSPVTQTSPTLIAAGRDLTRICYGPDRRIYFNRLDAQGAPIVFAVPANGTGTPTQISPVPHIVLGRHGGEIVLGTRSKSSSTMLYDPATGTERPLVVDVTDKLGSTFGMDVAPDGKSVIFLGGSFADVIWRVPLVPHAHAEVIHKLSAGETLDHIAVLDDGRVVGAPKVWAGSMHVIHARGGRF
jgi:dipeptidyl aminopeptidase/acylaminoacyl peptidase